jgi:hypothetical protein
MVSNRLSLLLDDDMDAVEAAAKRLRELLPGLNVSKSVERVLCCMLWMLPAQHKTTCRVGLCYQFQHVFRAIRASLLQINVLHQCTAWPGRPLRGRLSPGSGHRQLRAGTEGGL